MKPTKITQPDGTTKTLASTLVENYLTTNPIKETKKPYKRDLIRKSNHDTPYFGKRCNAILHGNSVGQKFKLVNNTYIISSNLRGKPSGAVKLTERRDYETTNRTSVNS